MVEKLYTPKELSEILKVDLETIYRWLRAGKFGTKVADTTWRITESDLEQLIKKD